MSEEKKPYHYSEKFDGKKFSRMETLPLLAGFPAAPLAALYRRMPNMQQVNQLLSRGYGPAVARFLLLVYDKMSPFVAEYPDLFERKQAAARYCDLKKDSEKYNKCMDLTDELVANALCDLLKFQNDLTWDLIVQYEKVFSDNRRKIMVGESAKSGKAGLDYVKLVKENRALAEEIKGLYVKFTGNDPEAEMAIMRVIPLRPELVADFDMPDWDPEFLKDEEE